MASRNRDAIAQAIRVQRARQMSGLPTAGFFGDILRGIGRTAVGAIPIVGTGISTALFPRKPTVVAPPSPGSCPPGFVTDSRGRCVRSGVTGAVQRFLPGGETGVLPGRADGFGEATVGAFGIPALVPAGVSSVSLRCPPGAVLGKDNLCYQKGSIPVAFRKWRPARKPPISAKDWKCLQVSSRLEKKTKAIAMKAGWKGLKR